MSDEAFDETHHSVVCAGCDYELRGLAKNACCPECATPVRRSLAARRLAAFRTTKGSGRIMALFSLLSGSSVVLTAVAMLSTSSSSGAFVFLLVNVIPVILVWAATWLAHYVVRGNWRSAPASIIGLLCGAAILCLGVRAFVDVSWLLDLGGTATGSSTAGLIFVVAPLYEMLGIVIGAGVGALLGAGVSRSAASAQ